MAYKLVVHSKKLNPPVAGRFSVEATCTFYTNDKPLITDILVKSFVDCLKADLEDRCAELEKIAPDYEAVPEGHEVTINKEAREQARIKMRAQEKIKADEVIESLSEEKV